jgi:nitrogen fixation protein FixH
MSTTESRRAANPWPAAIVVYFIGFFAFIVAFTVFATRQRVDLVSQDYYEQEIDFQKQLDRLNRTQPFNAGAAVTYDSARQQLSIALPPAHARRPASGQIRLYRPSDAGIDQSVRLAVNADGVQFVDARQMREGLWKVRVQWKVDGQEYFFEQPLVIPTHPHS